MLGKIEGRRRRGWQKLREEFRNFLKEVISKDVLPYRTPPVAQE